MIQMTNDTKQSILKDYLSGMMQKDIAAKYKVSKSAVSKLLTTTKMSELTDEKEPAPAPTETSSVMSDDDTEVSSIDNNSTDKPKSQALRGVNVLGVLECALENAYGNDAEIMSLKADSDTASIVSRYGGTAYSVQFGLAF
jgi:DNA-binding transcriptional regulator LsrR (DeoR family)